MRILLINDTLTMGGKERRLVELLKGLQHYPEVELGLCLFARPDDYPLIKEDFPQIFEMKLDLFFLNRMKKKDPKLFPQFNKVLKNFKPELVHSWGTMSSIYALPSLLGSKVKFMNANIADAPPKTGWTDPEFVRAQITFPFSDLVLGNSFAGLNAYKAPNHKRECVHNGFDFRRIEQLKEPDEIRARFKISTQYMVGMVAGFFPRKDFDTFLKAALISVKQREDVSYLAIGNGPTLEACQAMIPEAYRDRIIFTGHQSDVESIVHALDVGVLSTNPMVHGEGISNSILEYMALRKPAIGSRGGGTNEIIVDEETGFLVEPLNESILVEKIHFLLDHPERAAEMGQKGFERVQEHFNLKDMAATYFKLYSKLLNRSIVTV